MCNCKDESGGGGGVGSVYDNGEQVFACPRMGHYANRNGRVEGIYYLRTNDAYPFSMENDAEFLKIKKKLFFIKIGIIIYFHFMSP